MSRIILGNMLTRLAAPVVLASALGACSSMPDWVDPTGWFGSDSQATSDASGGTTADASQSDSGKTPDIADVPAKPTAPSTTDEQQQVANSLVADRAEAKYSAESLQGGTEPVAAPPPPADATSAPAPSGAVATPAASEAASDTSSTAESSASPAPTPEAAPQPAAADNTSNTEVATTESPASAVPAPAPMPTATPSAASPATEMQASFAPSHAPALDPSVEQYVPQRILSRYQATAAAAAVPGVQGMSTVTNKPAHRRKSKATQPEQATDTAAPAQ